jgi:hypothetical protein
MLNLEFLFSLPIYHNLYLLPLKSPVHKCVLRGALKPYKAPKARKHFHNANASAERVALVQRG